MQCTFNFEIENKYGTEVGSKTARECLITLSKQYAAEMCNDYGLISMGSTVALY